MARLKRVSLALRAADGVASVIPDGPFRGAAGATVPVAGNTRGYISGMSKVMVSLPEDLLAQLDTEAKRRSTSRSALLAAAARRELARRDSEQVAAAIARSERRFDNVGAFEAADLVRHNRDSYR
ncbi:MAG: ribbon-helix-helix protein, CopG family [Geodermatophilaceae bacterium]